MEVGAEAGGFREGSQAHAHRQGLTRDSPPWRLHPQPSGAAFPVIQSPPHSRRIRNEQDQRDPARQFSLRLTLHRPFRGSSCPLFRSVEGRTLRTSAKFGGATLTSSQRGGGSRSGPWWQCRDAARCGPRDDFALLATSVITDAMSTRKLEGKTALITGASKGLGRAMALALAEAGARLALVSRNLELLNETAGAVRQLGAEAVVFTADVTDEAQVLRLEKAVAGQFGKVQILINNAGMNIRKPVTDFTLAEWQQVMDTNLTGVFLMCRSFIPQMRGQGYGRILNLTSIMSHVALPGRTAYAASKAGLLGLTRALALELAPEKITVNGISPGPVATEMNAPLI